MNWSFNQLVEVFSKRDNFKHFRYSLHGLERECLRITDKGILSDKSHPQKLGSALTNPYITTDFCEAQLELITPPFQREEDSSIFLKALHCFINKNLPDDLIWPFSMPCRLPNEKSIPLGQYGDSATGKKKTKYRLGLGERYGRKMQTVSGTHYNFSFSEDFWQFLYKKFARKNQKLQNFISESYLHMMRNFLRCSWINTYLFGAAPAIDKSYLDKKPSSLKRYGWNTYYAPYGTSLRMSNIGYYSKVQAQLTISYNSLDKYIEDITYALNTKVPAYKGMKGLNENILQIENEHYSRIRAKQIPEKGESVLQSLQNRGIRYVEVRAVDINPYKAIGIAKHQIRFLHMFLIYSLFKKSPGIDCDEAKIILENQNKVALYGRKPGLKLQYMGGEKTLAELSEKILKELKPIAELLDKNFSSERYGESLNIQFEKLANPDSLSSARIIREMKEHNDSFQEFGLRLARENKKALNFCSETSKRKEMIELAAKKSLQDQKDLEFIEDSYLEGFEDLEISTQMLMKEAFKRKVKVEILDRKQNFIRLRKGRRQELIRQATFTSRDSIVSYWLMEDKNVSKKILSEHGLSVPDGDAFTELEIAGNSYEKFKDKTVMVKPTNTNFGIGITMIRPQSQQKYREALDLAFSHGKSVIVEQFIEGEEYRILTIGDKAVAVVNRIAANVIGDGKSTIKELVATKNADPHNYKFFYKYDIKLGVVEKDYLRSQKLTVSSVPKKGSQIFLRSNSNVSTGGDAIDYTSKIHPSYMRLAEKAAKAANAKLCGVDLIIRNIKKPATADNYSIIEINFNPSLHIHGFVVKGQQIDVAGKLLDFLGF